MKVKMRNRMVNTVRPIVTTMSKIKLTFKTQKPLQIYRLGTYAKKHITGI